MNGYSLELRDYLRREVAEKGRAAAFAFASIASFCFFYVFNCEKYAILIKICCVVIVIISFLRIQLIKNLKANVPLTERQWMALRLNVWINTLGWSIILTSAAVEHHFSGIHFIVATIVMCGFVSGSIITLSPDLTLFIPFNLSVVVPPVVIILLDYFGDNQYQLAPLLIVYSLYFIYQVKQVREYRHKVIQNFIFQMDLKKSNEKLLLSQNVQSEQTVKLIHTSRLAALGEMAAGIAHEVNNPLAIISGSIQQLERRIDQSEMVDKEGLQKHTSRSHQAVTRITKIISGLRLFAQQSDSLPKVKVPLETIIVDTLGFCQEMLKARFVRLDVSNIPEVSIECHPVQISQVLINLIKNAEDALTGNQHDDQRWVKLEFEIKENIILIYVSNGGTTIPTSVQEKLFQPFFTTKAVGKGTGLGLSISKGIMKEHGGDLIFKGDAVYTTFTIILPIA